MIQRAPRWMWLALGTITSTFVIIGIALAIPNGNGNADAKAVSAETRGCERNGSITTCSLVLPADGSMSEGIYASGFDGKLDWEATGPAGTFVCPDKNPCVRLREGAEALKVLRFTHKGGGEVTVTLTKSS